MNDTETIDIVRTQADRLARETRPKVSSKSYSPVRPRGRTRPPSWWDEGTPFMRLQTDDLVLDGGRIRNPDETVGKYEVAYRSGGRFYVIHVKRGRTTLALGL